MVRPRGWSRLRSTRGGIMSRAVDEQSFWTHIRRCAGKVSLVPDAVTLYLCMADRATPTPIKALITAALAYFLLPADTIPDWTPISGWVDDGVVMTGTLAIVGGHVTDEHRERARAWLGE
jgi:uncharacterized membrane protein YkvA (DUF1232 family)